MGTRSLYRGLGLALSLKPQLSPALIVLAHDLGTHFKGLFWSSRKLTFNFHRHFYNHEEAKKALKGGGQDAIKTMWNNNREWVSDNTSCDKC